MVCHLQIVAVEEFPILCQDAVAALHLSIAEEDDAFLIVPHADDHRLLIVQTSFKTHIGHAEYHDADAVDIEALSSLMHVDEVGAVHEVVHHAVVAPCVVGASLLAVEELIGHP